MVEVLLLVVAVVLIVRAPWQEIGPDGKIVAPHSRWRW